MLGEELRPGLWRWTAPHREWKEEVAAYAIELVLIDPLVASPTSSAPATACPPVSTAPPQRRGRGR